MLEHFIQRGGIKVNAEFAKKEDLFRWVADDAGSKGLVSSAERMYEALCERERQVTTEIQPGIALPHAKIDEVREMFLYVITSRKGIRFGGLGSGAKIAFLIGAPREAEHYLDVLAMIARLIQKKEFRETLKHADTADSIHALINEYCAIGDDGSQARKNRYALMLVLNDTEQMEIAMELAVESGIKSAQVIDSSNVSAKIAFNFPFVSLFYAKNKRISSRLLIGIAQEREAGHRLIALLKKEGIDIWKPGTGFLGVIPFEGVYGAVDADFF